MSMENSKIRIINWYWDVLIVEKGIRGGICHAVHQYAKANNKYTKEYDENKESSYLKYWDVNNLYGCTKYNIFPIMNMLFQ